MGIKYAKTVWKTDPRDRTSAPTSTLRAQSSEGGGGAIPVRTKAEQVSGVVAHELHFTTLSGTSAVQASRSVGVSSVRMPYAGSVLGLAYESDAIKTAGSVVFTVYIAGVATTAIATWSTNNSGDVLTFPAGDYPFAAGELLTVYATPSSTFAAGTANISIVLYSSFST